MITSLMLGIIWTVYGIAGLCGFQFLTEKYKGKPWTRTYIRLQGTAWLMLGVPWLIFYFICQYVDMSIFLHCLILVLISIPSIVYSIVLGKKYEKLLDEPEDS